MAEREEVDLMVVHPILDREKQTTLFNCMRSGAELAVLDDEGFLGSFGRADRRKFGIVLSQCSDVRDVLVACNLRLVRAIARGYSRATPFPYPEALSAGMEALGRSVDRFDPERGTMFSSYASQAIKREISHAFLQSIPERTRGLHRNLLIVKQIRSAFLAVFQREITDEELRLQLLANTKFFPRHVDDLMYTVQEPLSLERGKKGVIAENTIRGRVIEDHERVIDPTANTEQAVEDQESEHELRVDVHQAFSQLTDTEITVVRALYGFDLEHRSSADLAEFLGMTEVEVMGIHLNALAKLQSSPHLRARVRQSSCVPEKATVIDESSAEFSKMKNREKVRLLILSGKYTQKQIGSMLGMTHQGVSYFLQKLLASGEIKKEVDNDKTPRVKELRDLGYDNIEVAEMLGMEYKEVRSITRRLKDKGEIEGTLERNKRIKAEAVSEETLKVKAYLDALPKQNHRDLSRFFGGGKVSAAF